MTEATAPTPGRPIDRTLVLIGLMGAGKSSIGRRLADRLGLDFEDADQAIEAAAGMPISEIFTQFGEPYFRDKERRVIARLLDGHPRVLATGGGAFMDAETRALVRQRGLSIWLRADLDVLVRRCARRTNRPLLNGRDMATVLSELMDQRHPVYAEADLTVQSGDSEHKVVIDAILDALRARGYEFPGS